MGSEISGRILGYARVSTKGQDLAYQVKKLKAAGCVRIYREKRSAKNTKDRPELQSLLRSLLTNDVVLATATDRIARDPLDLLSIVQSVKGAGSSLKLLDEPFIDTTSEIADLIIFLLGWAARWHRRKILENTASGRECARKRGVIFGRPPKLDQRKREEILTRNKSGENIRSLSSMYGVSKSTIRRIIK